ncbi:MAG: hypothetical protein ACXVCY_14020 [Pseudobdellovibrionaceae bacterium]
MKYFFFVFAFLFSLLSRAENAGVDSLRFYLLNPEMRFERDGSQELVDRKPLNIAFEYSRKKISLALEYSRFQEDTGNLTSALQRIHQDYLLWLKYRFWDYTDREFTADIFAGGGAGAYEESVTTSLLGNSRTDRSGLKFLSGLVAGGEIVRKVSGNFSLLVGLDGRALISSDFDPNPIWSAVLRFGLQFTIN